MEAQYHEAIFFLLLYVLLFSEKGAARLSCTVCGEGPSLSLQSQRQKLSVKGMAGRRGGSPTAGSQVLRQGFARAPVVENRTS